PDSSNDQNPAPQPQDSDEEPPFDVPEPVVFDPNKATLQSVDEVFSQLELVADFALDLETTGLDPHTDRIRLVSIACRDLVGIRSFVLEWSDEVREKLAAILSQPELTIVGFNLAFDLAFLQTHGVKFKCKLFDVMLACEVYHGRPHISLEEAAREHLNIQIDKTLQAADWTGDITPQMIHYAATDAEVTYKLYEKIKELLSDDVNLARVVTLENFALPAVVEMSVNGVRIDVDGWKKLTDELENRRKAIEQQLIQMASRYGFKSINPNSVQQVRALLQKAGVQVKSTSTDILKTIKHPIASLICEYREIQKLCSAYGHDWLAKCKNGVCYPRWHQIGSETGRMSCSDPNLQQIPRGTGHRRLIIPRPGHVFIIADYSQIELRLMAEIADDEAMITAFRNNQDLHKLTASIILGKKLSDITPEERQLAKAVNFGLIYGMSARSLQDYVYSSYGVSISYEEAEQYKRRFLNYYRGVKRFHDYMASKFNRGDRVVTTKLGRRRTCTTLTQMINTPIQGSGADGLKLALAALSKVKNDNIRIILAIHDEIVIEAPEDQAQKAKELLVKAMDFGMSKILQKVPCTVEAHEARCWEK
ncbi:MAG: DNA polymerase, partial [Candidatus Hadarchaeales archaeon]